MAEVRTVRLVDDLDGSDAEETVWFGLDRKYYEIDLNADHAKALRENLAEYIENARKAAGPGNGRGPQRPVPGKRHDRAEIKAWADSRGIHVSDRGRIAKNILEQYEAEHAAA